VTEAGPASRRPLLAVYADRRMLAILLMGFASGLPLLLTTSTLSYWLSRRGVDKTAIGLFALVGLPYALKFVWAPALDLARIPGIDHWLGRRRAWTLVSQVALVLSILALGSTDPARAPLATAALALLVAFCSATQDVAIDAYRIEVLREHEQGAGAAVTQVGYRGGLLVAGAGAVALSDFAPWPVVFAVLAASVGVGVLGVAIAPEPRTAADPDVAVTAASVLEPLRDLLSRSQALAIVAFALLYKFGDAIAGTMAMPFYDELGFTGIEIASVTKVFGIVANLAGVVAGGLLVARLGIWRALLAGGVLQAMTNLLFAAQARIGHDLGMLAVAIGADGFTGGLASAAFVAYLSSLCRAGMSATQYALLTSLMAVGRTVLSSGSGWLADRLDWVSFFVLTTALAAPGLALLAWLWPRDGSGAGAAGSRPRAAE
jgi:PAT family beta-lactamase induction signal transducer AmpG